MESLFNRAAFKDEVINKPLQSANNPKKYKSKPEIEYSATPDELAELISKKLIETIEKDLKEDFETV